MRPIRFTHKDKSKSLFFATLQTRVDDYFIDNKLSSHNNWQMILKTIVLLATYILPFACILYFSPDWAVSLLLWALMGFAVAGIGMSIMHDANHGAYSSNGNVNYWMGHTISLAGGAVFNWKLQHNILHHTYTNIVHVDDDIDDKLVMRFSPHTKVKWYHKFQFVYAFLFYGILTLYWSLAKDFVQLRKYTKDGVNKNSRVSNFSMLLQIVLIKIIYFSILIVLPIVILKIPALQIILGFLLMHFIAGIVLTVVFQLAHTVEETTHPLPSAAGTIENTWAIHQMNTTVNFSRKSKWISWYVGGLNFQVEHHLFPGICHVHYPGLAPIVKATAEEFGIPYLENLTLGDAVRSHIRALKKFGALPTLNEAIS